MKAKLEKNVQALILAGGKGTRLRPLTLRTPKPVVPLANRPFLGYQLDLIKKAGIRDVVLSLSYRPDEVRKVMRKNCPRGLNLEYVVEEEPLGTGGGVRFASKGLDGTLVVFNGDVLIDLDVSEVLKSHRASGAGATIVLTRVEDPTVYGLVETDDHGRVLGFLEKPSWDEVKTDTINAGIYIIEQELLRYLPEGQSSIEREFFPELVRKREPFYAFTHEGYWLDIGTSEKYLQAHRDLLGGLAGGFKGYRRRKNGLFAAGGITTGKGMVMTGNAIVGPESVIGSGVTMAGAVALGRNVKVGNDSFLEDCVFWDNVEVGEGARLRGCILGRNAKVGSHAHISGRVVVGEKGVLPPYTQVSGGKEGSSG